MMTKKKEVIPNYKVVLEDWNEGVFATSLVGKPAIESDIIHYGSVEDIMRFGAEDKREIVGAVMIPDKKILRKNPETGEMFTVEFSKEVIIQLNERMKEYGYDNSFTFHHAYNASNSIQLLESWIKEFDEDKSNGYGFDLPIGTLFMKAKIKEDNLWKMIKEKKLNGFSIEVNVDYIKQKEEDTMSKVEAFERSLKQDNFTVVWDGEEAITNDTLLFTVTEVTVEDKMSEKLEKFSGRLEIEDDVFDVDKGIVTKVEKPAEPEVKEFSQEAMIKAINTAVTEQMQSIKDMFAENVGDKNSVAESLEEIKLFQKQNQTVKPKEEAKDKQFEMTNEILKDNIKTSSDWLTSRRGGSTSGKSNK